MKRCSHFRAAVVAIITGGWSLAGVPASADHHGAPHPPHAQADGAGKPCYLSYDVKPSTVAVPEVHWEKRTREVTKYRTETQQKTVTVHNRVAETKEVPFTFTETIPHKKTRIETFFENIPYTEKVAQRYTVMVPETKTRTVTYCVPVPVKRPVTQTYTVMVPEKVTKTQHYKVLKPVVRHVPQKYTICVPEQRKKTVQYTVGVPELRTVRRKYRVTVPQYELKTVTQTVGVPAVKTVKQQYCVNIPETTYRDEPYCVKVPYTVEDTVPVTVMVPHQEKRTAYRTISHMVPVLKASETYVDEGSWKLVPGCPAPTCMEFGPCGPCNQPGPTCMTGSCMSHAGMGHCMTGGAHCNGSNGSCEGHLGMHFAGAYAGLSMGVRGAGHCVENGLGLIHNYGSCAVGFMESVCDVVGMELGHAKDYLYRKCDRFTTPRYVPLPVAPVMPYAPAGYGVAPYYYPVSPQVMQQEAPAAPAPEATTKTEKSSDIELTACFDNCPMPRPNACNTCNTTPVSVHKPQPQCDLASTHAKDQPMRWVWMPKWVRKTAMCPSMKQVCKKVPYTYCVTVYKPQTQMKKVRTTLCKMETRVRKVPVCRMRREVRTRNVKVCYTVPKQITRQVPICRPRQAVIEKVSNVVVCVPQVRTREVCYTVPRKICKTKLVPVRQMVCETKTREVECTVWRPEQRSRIVTLTSYTLQPRTATDYCTVMKPEVRTRLVPRTYYKAVERQRCVEYVEYEHRKQQSTRTVVSYRMVPEQKVVTEKVQIPYTVTEEYYEPVVRMKSLHANVPKLVKRPGIIEDECHPMPAATHSEPHHQIHAPMAPVPPMPEEFSAEE
ncbi:hypothetical protein [Thalassoroseus pseudoceratinae]|uniref:hypothetical protein n=1 Tax=Thalassoroseus pseudoceratinae TaxID=2713176 RepID=UPI00141E483D|nr:hypothetical protein [Thalassoroseus pseudoceratinae]